MQHIFIEYIYLILIILSLVMVANKLGLAYPIVVVIGGLALSFSSRFSTISIDPDLLFLIFLPPLLYEAAWQVSWKEFWRWRRIIISFAFPIIIFTASVAFVSRELIPGFTLALGFLLGGIVSPPDAISATTIMRQVDAPRRIISVTEGESLFNDASSLIVFRFAIAAVISGQFVLKEAVISFFMVITMGSVIGLFVGLVFYSIQRWLPTTPNIDIVLSLVTPYCMYYFAEHFHYSGVLAVVSGGLLLSNLRLKFLSYQSRVQAVNVWTNLVFVLNGLIFLLIGLQLPTIVKQLGDTSILKAVGYGLVISFVLMFTRLLCTLLASPFTWLMSHFIKVADPNPQWKMPLIFGWAGMRGVVSLAAALSIPLVVSENNPFPYRNLILFITFIVILVTLVFQGSTLPWLIKKLNPKDKLVSLSITKQERLIQKELAGRSIEILKEKFGQELQTNEHAQNLYSKFMTDLSFYNLEEETSEEKKNSLKRYQEFYFDLLGQQRKLLNELNQDLEFDEELIRKYLSLIDLEEIKLHEKVLKEK